MARRKKSPQVAKPTKKQRLIEWGKDLLIVLLTSSAVILAAQTPMAAHLRGMVAEPTPTVSPVSQRSEEAVLPCAMAVRNSLGLYGVSYDEALVGRTFDRLSPLIADALATARAPETISRSVWQALLDAAGAYCSFQGTLPLSVVSTLLGGSGAPEGNAQALLLAWDGKDVWLCWREGETYRRAVTQVAYAGRLEDALEEFTPNGAAFAYALRAEDETYATLDGDVLLSMAATECRDFAASSPDFVGDAAALEQLLSALGFQSGVDFAYEAAGDLAINENGDRLRVSDQGAVTFHAGTEIRYPVACQGDAPTAAEAVLTAWELLHRAASPWQGEGSFVLAGVEQTTGGWMVSFQARLDGVPVWTGEEGWRARFTIRGAAVSDFSLTLRAYTAAETATALPGERLAAAALGSLPASGGRLTLRYTDSGSAALTAGWVAQD